MAVRRISDLPNLYTTYPNAHLSDCLLEVSYTPGNHIYQSFYEDAQSLLSAFPLPIATKDSPGIVMPGEYLSVDSFGVIDVKSATTSNAAVLIARKPQGPWSYVGTDVNGEFVKAPAPTVQILNVQPTEYLVLDYAYPVGAIYMTCNSSKLVPPGCNEPIGWNMLASGLNVAGVISADYVITSGDISAGIYNGKQMIWELLPNNCSPWSTYSSTEYDKALSAELPTIQLSAKINGQTSTDGSHNHSTWGADAGMHESGPIPCNFMHKNQNYQLTGGAHSHTISLSATISSNNNSVYTRTDTIARPTSYGVLMWKRINDRNVRINVYEDGHQEITPT